MKYVIGIGTMLIALAGGWFVLSPTPVDRPEFDLSRIPVAEPEGCDFVIQPKWFGENKGVISAAVAEAQEGARICVGAGDYVDAIRVDKPLSLIGFGAKLPLIISNTPADVVQWHADGGTLENVLLLQAGGVPSGSPVTGQNGGAAFIIGQPDYFNDETHSGLTIINSRVSMTNVGIQNDVFSGVFVSGPKAEVHMSNSAVSKNAEAGILMIGQASVSLQDTTIADNRNEGIRLDIGAQLTATGLLVKGNGGSAVYSQNNATFEIAGSVFQNGRAAGILMGHRAGPASVFDTEISGYPGLGGIAMRGGQDLALRGVSVSGGATGILCLPTISGPDSQPQRIEMRDSKISGNSRWGVSTSRICDVRIGNSTIANNKAGGIENGGVLVLSGSSVSQNGDNEWAAGITTGHVSVLKISKSTIANNRWHGLLLKSGAAVEVETSQITNNQDTGVIVPVLNNSEVSRQQQGMEALIARHGLSDLGSDIVFRDVEIGPHAVAPWRYDEGYVPDPSDVKANVVGLN
ncbi:MAG: right-handed parallel beta-helix repeat-containing protein [Litoreibacter sp.]|uniref:right-handed parallel beta-helix repeat-containing protein n=1 Tax=Litoreibacter sp. TaxID=1969459 RepID=UPI0032987689